MTRRRSSPPVTVAIDAVAAEMASAWWLFDTLGAERPTTVRVWHRPDGMTIRALSRTADGMRISAVVKLRAKG